MQTRKNTDYLAVHSTATPKIMDVKVEDIRRWHKARGWEDIGYHFVIYRGGEVRAGRPYWTIGAHLRGLNAVSLGIALVGGLSADGLKAENNFTDIQLGALYRLLQGCRYKYPYAEVIGHRDKANTECPSFNVKAWWEDIVLGNPYEYPTDN